ncbi:MAG: tRNA (adenosine(37)-N6)-dimethylallyltransferase MiaA [Rickettsiaceae bacterium]|nr:tRNA (adenosine(37)-N6)-dimethylallyltransferase MiaA [Rickettsiaceae bacterium]
MNTRNALIICGPTCSGKSSLALKYALKYNGAIINADSMQVYMGIDILSSSPSDCDKRAVPHFLYNFLGISENYNVGRYLNDIVVVLEECKKRNLLPIITGGTGLYINALVNGISEMPEVLLAARQEIDALYSKGGRALLYQELESKDPKVAAKINPSDTQRIERALGIFLSSSKSILDYQSNKLRSVLSDYNIQTIYLRPERNLLYQNAELRFDSMIKNGAVEQLSKLLESNIKLEGGGTKVLGFKHILLYLKGQISISEASIEAKQDTRNYAKRQYTWFNNQISWPHNTISSCSKDFEICFDNSK